MKTSNYTFDDLNEEPKQNIKAEKYKKTIIWVQDKHIPETNNTYYLYKLSTRQPFCHVC